MKNREYSYEQLEILTKIARHLANAEDLKKGLEVVLNWLSSFCKMNRGVIGIIDDMGQNVQALISVSSISDKVANKMQFQLGEGVTGKVFESGTPYFTPQISKEKNFLDRSGVRVKLNLSKFAFFCVPISYMSRTIGTLSVDKENFLISDKKTEINFLLEVGQLIAPFVRRHRLEKELELFSTTKRISGTQNLIGRSSQIKEVQKMLVRVADARTSVLITGETGTGKGVLATLMHKLSPFKNQPMIEINCGAIPENLIESELFGHEKGAFTGAHLQRIGVLERSAGGTVFLDEIGELPLSSQTKLLRVLQNREFERVGGSKTLKFSARIIAATNCDLEEAIKSNLFRMDLYYRLSVFPIHMPSLKERGKADIMLLADHFTKQFSEVLEKKIDRIDTHAIDMLTSYHWPGNVRELENVIERAVLISDTSVIHGHSLPPSLQMNKYVDNQEDHGDFLTKVKNFEIELITEALKDTNGNQTKAAKNLGITKRIMHYKISNYNIDYSRFKNNRIN